MAMSVVKEGNRFTVEWQEHFTISLPDTPSNRKAMLVFLRSLRDGRGKHVFTFAELSVIFDRNIPDPCTFCLTKFPKQCKNKMICEN